MVVRALAVLLLLQVPSDAGEVVNALRAAIRSGRAMAGAPAAAEPEAARRAAQARAQEAAGLPARRRLSSQEPLTKLLQRQGLARLSTAFEYMQEQKGYVDAASEAVEQFRDHPLWRQALDPAVTAVGVGASRAGDGALLLVVLLVEEPPVRDLRAMEGEVERAINRLRAQHGLPPLVPQATLIRVAREHSEDMVRRHYFDHVDPEGGGTVDRLRGAGVAWMAEAENIALIRGLRDAADLAVQGWMDSPGHRKNILNRDLTHTGVGIAEGEDGTYTFTQVFVAMRPSDG